VTLDELGAAGVIAVVRAPLAEAAVAACEALLRGGVRAPELTFTTPGVLDAIAALRRPRRPDRRGHDHHARPGGRGG
jgi:2-dehydro-3-deoxyphosphogluconate aldolase/(4S)-4-hydroxy-2-oxoglutarate aldolase